MPTRFDSVDSIIKPAVVVPKNLKVESLYDPGKTGKIIRKSVTLLEIPIQFLQRDNWKHMDNKGMTIKKTSYDKAKTQMERDELWQALKVPKSRKKVYIYYIRIYVSTYIIYILLSFLSYKRFSYQNHSSNSQFLNK
jgi:hypothetical protein